ncbi:MAG: hypothetical protein EOM62_18995 [Bacteroidia bacterium]|nr:hypothetical protein [Bacteroidia bacterium]
MVKAMTLNEINPYRISFNYKFGKVRIFQKNICELNNPKYVQLLLSLEEKALYLVGIDEREKDCFPVPDDAAMRANGFVLNGQPFIRRIGNLVGWSLERTHVIAGIPDAVRRCVVFDLHSEILETDENAVCGD